MKRLALMYLVMLLFALNAGVQAQESVRYRYAYAAYTGPEAYFVQLVDPTSGEIESMLVPPLEGFQTRYVIASPDGMWLAVVMSRLEAEHSEIHGSEALRLFSPSTGEIRDIVSDWLFRDIVWSPDSRWLAFLVEHTLPNAEFLPTYIYQIASGTTRYLDGANKFVYGLSWSPDSSRLLTASTLCEASADCDDSMFEIFDSESLELVQNLQFDAGWDRACNFTWSPDMQRIAFRFSCGDGMGMGGAEYFRDLYLWTLESNSTEQITFFTRQPENGRTLISYSYSHSFAWYDNESLFSSSYGGQFQGGVGYDIRFMQQGATLLHMDGTEIRLDRQPLMSWALNPLYPAEIAYRREDHDVFTDDYDMTVDEVVEASIEVATFDGRRFQVLYSGAAGCDLRWSPDGMMLAYSVYDPVAVENCYNGLRGVAFVSRETWGENSVAIADEYLNAVGWLVVGE